MLLAQASSGVGIDIALGGVPFEQSAVDRSPAYESAPGIRLLAASAEDFIVMKAFTSRPKDWMDEERILIRQRGQADWAYVEMQPGPLV